MESGMKLYAVLKTVKVDDEYEERAYFYPSPEFLKGRRSIEVEVPAATLDGWLSYELDEYVDELEPLPNVEWTDDADVLGEDGKGAGLTKWDVTWEGNVRNAAKGLAEKGLLPFAVCNYLNLEGYNVDPFWISCLSGLRQKFSPKRVDKGV